MVFSNNRRTKQTSILFLLVGIESIIAADIPEGDEGFNLRVQPFLEQNCIRCHGTKKQKGKVTLHDINTDQSADHELERWENVLDMLKSGEMPPEDEDQPSAEDRQAVVKWIDAGLRAGNAKLLNETTPSVARRLTNIEYENTIRDLLGFKLNLIDDLPKDPVKPYHFNNSAEFMQMGPEQIDHYRNAARHAMESAIVDPAKPEVKKTRAAWQPTGVEQGLGNDEVGVWGNRRGSPSPGIPLQGFPEHGEFRIRFKASAILPKGVRELPLRLVMGYNLNVNNSMLQMEPVGTVRLSNDIDHPQEFEFRGRIENYPTEPTRAKNGSPMPDTLTITPQNLYDDGTLNDNNGFSKPRNLTMPRAVIEWLEFEAPLTDVWPPAYHTRILFDSSLRTSNPKEYVHQVLRRFMSRAFRRPATDQEVESFAKIYDLVIPELGTMEAAMRETLSMVLISPQFLYHTIEEEGVTSKQHELASKLSYLLWSSMPDNELLGFADRGELDDPKVIEKQVRRLLADERSHDFVSNFTLQWLSLEKMKTVPINKDLFPRFLYYVPLGERAGTEEPYRPTIRSFMLDESVEFIAELIKRNASVMQIVDSDFAMLNQPLAAHYGVEGVHGDQLRPVALKTENHLGGLLTQGSMLIGNGTGSAPHPIYRAVWLREAILGDEVKPPPADVPALSETAGDSADKALTIKDLLAKHRTQESCNDCHARLDPWGIPFEQYNAIGKFQPMVPKAGTRVRGVDAKTDKDLTGYLAYLKTINTQKIEADSRLPHGPSVTCMEDLKAYLLTDRKDDIAANVLRRLLVYGLGRNLTFRDRLDVEKLLKTTKENGYLFQDMIVEVCKSDVFRGTKP